MPSVKIGRARRFKISKIYELMRSGNANSAKEKSLRFASYSAARSLYDCSKYDVYPYGKRGIQTQSDSFLYHRRRCGRGAAYGLSDLYDTEEPVS